MTVFLVPRKTRGKNSQTLGFSRGGDWKEVGGWVGEEGSKEGSVGRLDADRLLLNCIFVSRNERRRPDRTTHDPQKIRKKGNKVKFDH